MTDTQYETHKTRGDLHDSVQGHGAPRENGSHDTQNGAADHSEEREEAIAKSQRLLRSGIEAATNHARTASDQMAKAMGFSGEGADKLAEKSKQDMEAVSQFGAILNGAFQTGLHRWFEIGQKQWQRNLDGLDKLAQSKSLHEFSSTQSELARESLQHMINDCHVANEASLKTTTQACDIFKGK